MKKYNKILKNLNKQKCRLVFIDFFYWFFYKKTEDLCFSKFIDLLTSNVVAELHLGDCDIGDEGVIALAEALKENRTLTTLNLWGNIMGPRAIRH